MLEKEFAQNDHLIGRDREIVLVLSEGLDVGLEVFVHLDISEDLPMDRHYVEIDIPDDIAILELKYEDLPDGWDSKPPILETQYIGDDFVKEKVSAVMKVPCCIVKQEFNYLINPNHPDARRILVESTTPFQFDSRFQQQQKKEK